MQIAVAVAVHATSRSPERVWGDGHGATFAQSHVPKPLFKRREGPSERWRLCKVNCEPYKLVVK